MIYQILKPGDCVVPMFVEAESLKATNGVIELRDNAHALVAAVSISNVHSVIAMEVLRAKREDQTGGTSAIVNS